MDFSKFETKQGAEEGRFCHFRDPKTNELLYDTSGKKPVPAGAFLRGMESKTVQEVVAVAQRKESVDGEDAEGDTAVAKALVISFQGIDRADKPLTVSDDDLEWFFGLSSHWVFTVVNFARQVGNFLPLPSKT